ncbi:mycothiol system anti-sigma-R factor [Saccharothrix stipae]
MLSEVYLFLDHECDETRKALLQTHLEECHPCLEQYGIEEHLKALLARKCGGEHAPDELRRRLRARLYQTADQTTLEVEVTTTVTTTEKSGG